MTRIKGGKGRTVAGVLALALLALMLVCALSDCSKVKKMLAPKYEDGYEAVGAVDAHDQGSEVAVGIAIDSCEVLDSLPDDQKPSDVLGYNAEYNARFGSYIIEEDGSLSEGWSLVVTTLKYRNENNGPCRLSLGGLKLMCGENPDTAVEANKGEPYIINGIKTKEEYYLPVLEAHTEAEYLVGFFVPTESLTESMWIRIEGFPHERGGTQKVLVSAR